MILIKIITQIKINLYPSSSSRTPLVAAACLPKDRMEPPLYPPLLSYPSAALSTEGLLRLRSEGRCRRRSNGLLLSFLITKKGRIHKAGGEAGIKKRKYGSTRCPSFSAVRRKERMAAAGEEDAQQRIIIIIFLFNEPFQIRTGTSPIDNRVLYQLS